MANYFQGQFEDVPYGPEMIRRPEALMPDRGVNSGMALSGQQYVTDDIQSDLGNILNDALTGNLNTVNIPERDVARPKQALSLPSMQVDGTFKSKTPVRRKKKVEPEYDEIDADPIDITIDMEDDSPYVRDMSAHGTFLDALARAEADAQGKQFSGNMEQSLAGDTPMAMLGADLARDRFEADVETKGSGAVLNQANLANQLQRGLNRDSMSADQQSSGLLNKLLGAYSGADMALLKAQQRQPSVDKNAMRDYLDAREMLGEKLTPEIFLEMSNTIRGR